MPLVTASRLPAALPSAPPKASAALSRRLSELRLSSSSLGNFGMMSPDRRVGQGIVNAFWLSPFVFCLRLLPGTSFAPRLSGDLMSNDVTWWKRSDDHDNSY